MKRYEWEGYRLGEPEPCCDGIVFAYNEPAARQMIEEDIRKQGLPMPDEIRIVAVDFVGCEAPRWQKR